MKVRDEIPVLNIPCPYNCVVSVFVLHVLCLVDTQAKGFQLEVVCCCSSSSVCSGLYCKHMLGWQLMGHSLTYITVSRTMIHCSIL